MALTATVFFATFAVFDTLAVPLVSDNTSDVSSTFSVQTSSSAWTTDMASSSTLAFGTAAVETASGSIPSADSPQTSGLSSSMDSSSATSSSAVSSSSSPTASITTVVSTVYEAPPTVTVTAPPQTVTDTITIVPPPAPAPTIQQTAWSAPPQMTDLSAFNVQNFAFGSQNMRIIVNAPPNGSTLANDSTAGTYSPEALSEAQLAVASAASAGAIPPPPGTDADGGAFLQLFYPANSINPAQAPQGGADFYAAPLDLRAARNVSLEYSVFFPADFDFVAAGKLPGIYGGHDGCSGGDDALECFSTRLMWRAKGVGELYLYAPKDKQTAALCATPPQSVCDAAYGLSVGRGAFAFAPGHWTHVRQTVTLNTPGMQDGAFALDVDGRRVIERADVYYRGLPADAGEESVRAGPALGLGPGLAGAEDDFVGAPFRMEVDSVLALAREFTPDFAPFAPLGGGADSNSGAGAFTPAFAPPAGFAPGSATVPDVKVAGPDYSSGSTSATTVVPAPQTVTVTVYPTSTATAYVMALATDGPVSVAAAPSPTPVGFTGLFFSTFFGGHEPKYATPRDQFAWFKGFSMTINA